MNRHRIIIATLALLTILSACNPITNPTASRESGPRGSGASARITPIPVERFDFPLDPTRFGPYVYNVTGPLNVDTRFGAQNPGLGNAGKCFVDFDGNRVPFNQLYHAGEDWFALNSQGLIVSGLAANAAVFAVAHGVVSWTQSTGGEGDIVVIEHARPDGTMIWSAYWHLSGVNLVHGQAVRGGDTIGRILDRGFNSHLHWEIRTWGDGSNLFPTDSAGGRGSCNGRAPALAYTWDDDPFRSVPQSWGYHDPTQFILDNR